MTEEEDCRAQADMHAGCFHSNRVNEGSSWQKRSEWYERHDAKLSKTLLRILEMLSKDRYYPEELAETLTKIKKMVKNLDLKSDWVGEGEEVHLPKEPAD